jgi:hypothetical protein
MEVYTSQQLNHTQLQCTRCTWSGTGDRAIIIDFYGVADIKEVHCPDCDTQIAALKNEDDHRGESADQVSFQIG